MKRWKIGILPCNNCDIYSCIPKIDIYNIVGNFIHFLTHGLLPIDGFNKIDDSKMFIIENMANKGEEKHSRLAHCDQGFSYVEALCSGKLGQAFASSSP